MNNREEIINLGEFIMDWSLEFIQNNPDRITKEELRIMIVVKQLIGAIKDYEIHKSIKEN